MVGTGESGKSTVFKQMQILHEDGFSEIEKSTFRHVIRINVVESMQALLWGLDRFRIPMSNQVVLCVLFLVVCTCFKRVVSQESQQAATPLMGLDPLSPDFWVPSIVQWVTHLWKNEPGIAAVYARRSEMQILDSAP